MVINPHWVDVMAKKEGLNEPESDIESGRREKDNEVDLQGKVVSLERVVEDLRSTVQALVEKNEELTRRLSVPQDLMHEDSSVGIS